MRSVPTLLALLSFPAGAIAYAMTVQALAWLDLSGDGREILMLFVPLFVAGLVMMPFLIPFIDRKAKADLAAIASVKREAPLGSGDDELGSGDDERGTGDDQPEAPDKP